ncbi:MAG: AAA family ATPase [Pseudomonadota bacterium]
MKTTPTPASAAINSDAVKLVEALRVKLKATLVETHISWVLLGAEFAWKIKKPVRLSFLDFGDLAKRQHLCEEELRLNRRLAPTLYLDVLAIRGTPDDPSLEGDGPVIEYALRMKRFAEGALLSERLAAGQLEPAQLDRLAQGLASFHRTADVAPAHSPYGTARAIEETVLQVVDGLSQQGCAADCAVLHPWLKEQSRQLSDVWRQRKAEGQIREGHGDLHLANAVVLGEEVTAFDCIEFDPALRTIDVLSDVAFLVMDLLAHERPDLAFRFLNAYLDESGDQAGLPVLRYYLVYRALVRGLVARLSGHGKAADQPDYLALARRLTDPPDARLLIMHGVSGSGKSVVAQQLLEHAQAIRLRSDVERKRLFGLQALDDSTGRGPGPSGVYEAEATRRTYARLRELAACVLSAGYRVIVDATFLRAADRADFHRLAKELRVPFTILHCHAPPEILRERVHTRRARGDDASEADLSVLERQLVMCEPLLAPEQVCAITVDTVKPPEFDS